MIDIQLLRSEPEKVKKGMADKGYDPSIVDNVLEMDNKKRKLIQEKQTLQAVRNIISDPNSSIAKFREQQGGSDTSEVVKKAIEFLESGEKEKRIEAGKLIKLALQKLNDDVEFDQVFNTIPNMPFDDVPVGKGEDGNKVLREVGDKPKFDFQPKNHLELGEALGIIDFESGAKVSGSQFYYLSGDAVMLEFALIQFGLELLSKKGYRPYLTPDMAKSRYYLGTGYQPKGEEAQIYEIEGEDLGLIATAEVTMAGLHADAVLSRDKLPLKYAAISHCFRKEAGAYGKYSKGLYRVHQFTKLEMFVYCTPEDSKAIHEELLGIEEEIVKALEIPYRVVEMCTGDLGAMAAKKYDLEAWMPGRGDYGEITSTSNTTDYQARNLNIKYRNNDKNEYVHMLNGTAVVLSRIPIAIMENYQNKDGSINIPKVLQKWMGKEIIKK